MLCPCGLRALRRSPRHLRPTRLRRRKRAPSAPWLRRARAVQRRSSSLRKRLSRPATACVREASPRVNHAQPVRRRSRKDPSSPFPRSRAHVKCDGRGARGACALPSHHTSVTDPDAEPRSAQGPLRPKACLFCARRRFPGTGGRARRSLGTLAPSPPSPRVGNRGPKRSTGCGMYARPCRITYHSPRRHRLTAPT